MGDLAKGRKRIGIVIDDALVMLIETRAQSLHMPPSRYAAMIVERWRTEGCPPISEPDRLMQIAQRAEHEGKQQRKAS